MPAGSSGTSGHVHWARMYQAAGSPGTGSLAGMTPNTMGSRAAARPATAAPAARSGAAAITNGAAAMAPAIGRAVRKTVSSCWELWPSRAASALVSGGRRSRADSFGGGRPGRASPGGLVGPGRQGEPVLGNLVSHVDPREVEARMYEPLQPVQLAGRDDGIRWGRRGG